MNATPEHMADVEAWHARRIAALRGPDGWLALVGLHWLKDGTWSLGSSPSADIVLPPQHAAGIVGSLQVHGTSVEFTAAPDAEVRAAGKRIEAAAMLSDARGATPTLLQSGSTSFYVIERGGALALRLRDSEAAARHAFKGIERFAVDDAWKLAAKFVPYAAPKRIVVPTVIGTMEEQVCPGALVFSANGKQAALDAVQEPGEESLFIVFADATNGHGTYGTGRFLYVARPSPGSDDVVVDFNKAYNPPCAFTSFATCPLPPPQNRLPFAVQAGEKH